MFIYKPNGRTFFNSLEFPVSLLIIEQGLFDQITGNLYTNGSSHLKPCCFGTSDTLFNLIGTFQLAHTYTKNGQIPAET